MKRWAVCMVVIVLAGCASMLPEVTVDDARRAEERWPGTTQAMLEQGRQKYIDRCGGCHSLHLPAEFTEAEWQRAVNAMQARAKVGVGEKELILRYLAVTRNP
jgi:hypothetical protein